MFWHNFKYTIKTLLRNKMLLFWTFIFPIILGTFFNMAFSDIENKESLDIINIAIINNSDYQNDTIFKNTIESLSNKNTNNQIFNITYTDLSNSKDMLAKDKITGYLTFKDNNVNITVKKSGINETILRYVVDEINSQKEIINTLSSQEIAKELASGNTNIDYEKIYSNVINLISNTNIKINDISNTNLSYTMIEYYTLIAMASLYGGIISMFVMNYKLANMSGVGKRTAISPINKSSLLLSSLLASYIIQLLGLMLLFLYTILIIKVDYGTNLPLVLLLAAIGSLAGLTFGIMISTVIKANSNTKTGIMIAITMFFSFLSGMMGITMKYVIDKNIPILNKINPANMITDGLYSLYYYDTLNRYYFNIVSLLVFSIIMLLISYQGLRREKYDSI